MKEITIDTIRNTNPQVIEILDKEMRMNDEQLSLLVEIMELCADRPDRQQYALEYTGRMNDLPAALAQI